MSSSTFEGKKKTENGTKRLIFTAVSILLEIVFLLFLFTKVSEYATIIDWATRIVAIFLVLGLYSMDKTSSMKMPWIILMLAFPILGVSLYLLVGLNGSTKKMRARYEEIDKKLLPYLPDNRQILEWMKEENPQAGAIASYLTNYSCYPVYQNTDVTYYDEAIKGLDAQLEDLSKAEKFIFMEYHAIEDEEAWQRIQTVLEDRVKAGVEVRIFYDDMGSIWFVNMDFATKLKSLGIKCRVFNPILPGLNMFLNNRDHRKITVIDGMWNAAGNVKSKELVPEKYVIDYAYQAQQRGYVQPYADSPLDDEQVGEEVYISMANKAEKYCWFITPYLIITDEMTHALTLAAKRGVDVRIITPGIPDKKMVYSVTRSFYHNLVKHGVRIYEWTPGFCHAKMSVADDRMATCGTINLDYRSLYHHFENGCFLADCDAVLEIRDDLIRTMGESREVTEQYKDGRSAGLRLGQLILRLFAELL